MDMDSSHDQNWLAFSLSNHSLFHPLFNSSTTTNPSSSCGLVDQENGSSGGPATDHHLSLLAGGPKLEDFLGASGGSSAVHATTQYDVAAQGVTSLSDVAIYGTDSELKCIAASFLRGFSNHDTQKQLAAAPPPDPPAKKAVETFGQRTSIFRGVTRHRWTGRYEAHLWDNSCRREGQSRKGRQVYLGGYDKEEKAARAYDLAALKYWGPTTTTNFPVSDYEREMEDMMKHMTRQEFVASLRRKSSGFSRGASIYRGVTRHHQHGRWQARIGRVAGNKDLYLGTFSTQEEAAEAYDIAAIKFRGLNAVTNFDMSRYDVRSIASSNLPIGGVNNKSKTSAESLSDNKSNTDDRDSSTTSVSFPSQNSTGTINFAHPVKQDHSSSLWNALGYQNFTNTTKNPNTGVSLFQDSNFNMDQFQANNSESFYNGNGYFQNQENGVTSTDMNTTTTTSSTATLVVPGNGAATDDAVLCNANWSHSYQAGKTNLSTFQTPIFGME